MAQWLVAVQMDHPAVPGSIAAPVENAAIRVALPKILGVLPECNVEQAFTFEVATLARTRFGIKARRNSPVAQPSH